MEKLIAGIHHITRLAGEVQLPFLLPILEQQTEKIKIVQEELRNNIEELDKIRVLIDQNP